MLLERKLGYEREGSELLWSVLDDRTHIHTHTYIHTKHTYIVNKQTQKN